ncbi:hypothetical protein, partial [Klebsiella pneumoniae]
ADRNRSHWSTSKTPSYTKSTNWQHHLEMMGYFLRIDSERNPSAGSAITRIISGNIRGDCALGFP